MLRLSDPRHVYTEAAPVIVDGQVIHLEQEGGGPPDPAETPNSTAATPDQQDDRETAEADQAGLNAEPEIVADGIADSEASDSDKDRAAQTAPAVSNPPQRHGPTAERRAENTANPLEQSDALAAREWLASKQEAGAILMQCLDPVSAEHFRQQPDGRVFMLHVPIANTVGRSPLDIIKVLDAAGMIPVDPRKPMVRVAEIGGVKGVLFNKETSKRLAVLLPGEEPPMSHPSNPPTEQTPGANSRPQSPRATPVKRTSPAEVQNPIEQLVNAIKAFEVPFAVQDSGDTLTVDLVLLRRYVEDERLFEFKALVRYAFNRTDISIDNIKQTFIVKK